MSFPTCFQSKEMKLAVIWRNFRARRKMFCKILNPILARYLRRNIKFCQMAKHENWFNFWSCYNAHTHYLTLQLNRLWIEISATMTKSKPKKKKSNLDSKSRKAKQKKMSRQRQFMDESLSQAGKFQLKSSMNSSQRYHMDCLHLTTTRAPPPIYCLACHGSEFLPV